MNWNSWGVSWLTSWGASWGNGTDIEVDEEHGGGGGAGYERPRRKHEAARNTQEKDLMEMLTVIMAACLLEG